MIIKPILTYYIYIRKFPFLIFQKHLLLFRSVLLVGGGLFTIFGSTYINWSGSGPLGCLSLAFVAALRWRQEVIGGQHVS